MAEENKQSELSEEFKAFGKELETFLRTLWESEERKRIQQDVESGLVEVGQALESFVRDLQSSEDVQEFKREMEDVAKRFRTGEVQEKAKAELLSSIRRANAELKKATDHYRETSDSSAESESAGGDSPEV
jgi:hypothetical protein